MGRKVSNMGLSDVVQLLHPDAVPIEDYRFEQDDSGALTLAHWNTTKLGTAPAIADLQAKEADAATAERNKQTSWQAELEWLNSPATFTDMAGARASVTRLKRDVYLALKAMGRRLESDGPDR